MPAWQGFDATHGIDYAVQKDDVMQRRLGSDVYDERGNRWVYVQFREAATIGMTYRDAGTIEIVGAAPGVFAAAATVNSRILNVANQFGANADHKIGAFGQVTTGSGRGQMFYITGVNIEENDDHAQIAILAGGNGAPVNDPRSPGWKVAIPTSSQFQMRAPGWGVRAHRAYQFIRGFVQQNIVAADIGKYGYVLAEGLGYARLDQSASNVPTVGEPIIPVSGGLITGISATETAMQVGSSIGTTQFGDVAYTADDLIMIEAHCPSKVTSFRQPPYTEHPLIEQRVN